MSGIPEPLFTGGTKRRRAEECVPYLLNCAAEGILESLDHLVILNDLFGGQSLAD